MDTITEYASARSVTTWSGGDRHKWGTKLTAHIDSESIPILVVSDVADDMIAGLLRFQSWKPTIKSLQLHLLNENNATKLYTFY